MHRATWWDPPERIYISCLIIWILMSKCAFCHSHPWPHSSNLPVYVISFLQKSNTYEWWDCRARPTEWWDCRVSACCLSNCGWRGFDWGVGVPRVTRHMQSNSDVILEHLFCWEDKFVSVQKSWICNAFVSLQVAFVESRYVWRGCRGTCDNCREPHVVVSLLTKTPLTLQPLLFPRCQVCDISPPD